MPQTPAANGAAMEPKPLQPLPTAAVADACVRVRHAGSVDVFFEALQTARPGQVLCIDNGGRLDEGCIGGHAVTAEDVVALDDDGGVFVPRSQAGKVWDLARRIQATEAEQARLAKSGQPLCEQFQVKAFLSARKTEPGLGFRAHLRSIGKAIEE